FWCSFAFLFFFFFHLFRDPRVLHSFPTRRSSDLLSGCKSVRCAWIAAVIVRRASDDADRNCRAQLLDAYVGRRQSLHFTQPKCTDRKSTRPELQSQSNLVCRLLLEKKKKKRRTQH